MVETLVISLILATLSGLSFVAYKHPRGYRRIALPLGVTVLGIVVGLLAFTLGGALSSVGSLKENLDRFPDHTLQSVEFSINSLYHDRNLMLVVLVVGVATLGYLFFLYNLPKILECEPDATDTKDTDKTHPTNESNATSG